MARISTYTIEQPTIDDFLIGTDADGLDSTKNYLIGDIIKLIPGGGLSVQSLNTLTGTVSLAGKGGLVITEVGNIIFLDVSNAGQFDSLTTTGTTGVSTLTGGVLNIPNYANSGVTDVNSITGSVSVQPKGGLVITEVSNVLFLDASNVGQFRSLTTTGTTGLATLTGGVLNIPDYANALGVKEINSIEGNVTLSGKGGIVITEVGSIIFVDGTNAGQFDSLTTIGNNGSATLTGGILNVPQYQRGITVTTGGSGAASLVGAQLNIPYEPISLTTIGNNGPASLSGNNLNVPQYQREITVTTGGSGASSLVGAQLNIPYYNAYNTGAPVNVVALSGGSSTIPAGVNGITTNIYSATWSGGNGTYILTLPSAVTDAYRTIRIITNGTFSVNTFRIEVTAPGLETINGASFVEVNTSYSGILVWSDGANWRVI